MSTQDQSNMNAIRFIFGRLPGIAVILMGLLLLGMSIPASVNPGTVKSHQKISDTLGGFLGSLDDNDSFGTAAAAIGDLDSDGIPDLAVGARYDDDGGMDRGAVWILFMNPNGTVKSHQKISDTTGNFTGTLDNDDRFGRSITAIGDLDGDRIPDLAVGAKNDDDGGTDKGAVWILFMSSNGTVKSHQKISDTAGNFTGILDNGDNFGGDLSDLGDLDGDTVPDLAVGASRDDDGGTDRGAVWILFMNSNGTVKSHQKISDTVGNFTGILDNLDSFGVAVATLDDLDGDDVIELAVGVWQDDDGGTDRGAIWVLFMNSNGTVKSHQKISDTAGNFTGTLDNSDYFGVALTTLDDLDGDNVPELAAGAYRDDDGGSNRGAVWILFMNPNGTVKGYQKISDTEGGFSNNLDDGDDFGHFVTTLNDLNGDSVQELVVGAKGDDDGGPNRGAIWVLFLNKHTIYLPVLVKNYVVGSDLVVESLIVNSSEVIVVIKNIDPNVPATDAFRVDLYIDPDPVPSAVNQPWTLLSTEGLVWNVTQPIPAGGQLALTINDPYYVAGQSTYSGPPPSGTPIYAQVDSVNFSTTYGNVRESHEISGGAYNNITGTVAGP